jgi:LruC domain-containing protein
MAQHQEQLLGDDERFGLNRRRVLQGIAATSVVGFGGARTAMPVYAQSNGNGCACSEATCDVTVPLCAAQTEDVGTVQTQVINTEDGLVLEVRYDLDEGYELGETHLYVGKTCPEELTSAPGQFPFSDYYSSGVTGDRYLINFDDICEYEVKGGNGNGRGRGNANGGNLEKAGNCGFSLGDCVYVAAHAVVVQRNDDGEVTWEETAWGDGCDGARINEKGNWATYFSYTSSFCDVFPETIFVGYEDLPEGEGNDYDYNDFLVRLDTEFDAQQTEDGFEVEEIRFDITPRARGARFEHVFHMLFPADSLCDGEYDLTVFDGDGNVDSSMSDVSFSGDSDNDIVIFDDTGDVFPDQTNTRQVNDCVAPNRTATLTLTFDAPCPFDIEGLEPTAPNGSGLFFDPYITVNQTGETIDAGDIRLLTVPDTWLWPQERVPIWDIYTEVDDDGTGQPVFTTETWFDGGFDATKVYDRC